MQLLETEIEINASPQTVWSVLDDISRYSEWNPTVPKISGKTKVDSVVELRLVQPNTPDLVLEPTIVRFVGARELRWISYGPDLSMLSAEHIFILKPRGDGGCRLIHNEIFTGTLVEQMWPGITVNGRKAYNDMNVALKKRAESMELASVSLHPSVDGGIHRGKTEFKGATLRCPCASNPVAVSVNRRAILTRRGCGQNLGRV
jgi:hypothetical protein